MNNLDYKGSKGTRAKGAIVLFIVSLVLLATSTMTTDQWIDFVKWVFGIYATSEGVAKGASAYAEKQ